MTRLCTWCTAAYEPRANGGKPQRFCSESCRRDFHTACRIWGEEVFGAGEVTVFQLRTCLGRRARRYLASEGIQEAPEAEKRTSTPPGAAVPVVEIAR